MLKNGNQNGRSCAGRKIYVQINGFKQDSVNEAVTCEVGKIQKVGQGKKAVWKSEKSNLGDCSNVLFDVSAGKEPKVQVKTDAQLNYCPKSVELKINGEHFCGETNQSGNDKGYYYKGMNSIIHDTTRGRCK